MILHISTTYFIRRRYVRADLYASVIKFSFVRTFRWILWFLSSQSLNVPCEDQKNGWQLPLHEGNKLPANDNCPRVWTGKIYIDSFLVGSSREWSQTPEYLTFRTILCINPSLEEHIDSPNHSWGSFEFWLWIFMKHVCMFVFACVENVYVIVENFFYFVVGLLIWNCSTTSSRVWIRRGV